MCVVAVVVVFCLACVLAGIFFGCLCVDSYFHVLFVVWLCVVGVGFCVVCLMWFVCLVCCCFGCVCLLLGWLFLLLLRVVFMLLSRLIVCFVCSRIVCFCLE